MLTPRKLLSTSPATPAPPLDAVAVESDVVVILAALLCAVICGAGLALVARCTCLRRRRSDSFPSDPTPAPPLPPSRGLEKKVLRSLPKLVLDGSLALPAADCPICLAEFAGGDEIRVLPQCGHGFHAWCVDRWLESHSSCPSCRRILSGGDAAAYSPAAPRCEMCGASPPLEEAAEEGRKSSGGSGAAAEGGLP